MTEPLTLYKLIILYMLGKVNFPLTNSQISEFILDKGYTNYFTVQQAANELLESGLISSRKARGTTYLESTREGQDTLSYFQARIPPAIIEDIKGYLSEHQYELKNEVAVQSNYYPGIGSDYTVRLQVLEGRGTLVDLALTVPDEQTAALICGNWEKKSQEIYAYLMDALL